MVAGADECLEGMAGVHTGMDCWAGKLSFSDARLMHTYALQRLAGTWSR
jgi:hypothetical protein